MGRIAVVAVPVLVLVVIIAVVAGNSRDERSYQYGRESAIPAQVLLRTAIQGGAWGDMNKLRTAVCRDMVNRNRPEGIVFDDAMAGCLDAL